MCLNCLDYELYNGKNQLGRIQHSYCSSFPPPTLWLKNDGKKHVLQVTAHWSRGISGRNSQIDYQINLPKLHTFFRNSSLAAGSLAKDIASYWRKFHRWSATTLPLCILLIYDIHKIHYQNQKSIWLLGTNWQYSSSMFLWKEAFLSVQNEWNAHTQEVRANTNIFSIFKMSVNDSFLLVYLFLEHCLEGFLKVLKYSHEVGELLFKIIMNLSSPMFC